MTARLRWGLLGTARINRVIIPRLRELPRHELVAVASRDEGRADAYARQWGIPRAMSSYEALLARDDVDVVYIALPNSLHAQWTVRAAEAGKHVLCEKPLATSVADVDAIITAARRAGTRVAEGLMYAHHPQTARVREIVARGDVGDLRLIRGAFSFSFDRPGDIRWSAQLDGGALWDVGCYPVSYARSLAGHDPGLVFATGSPHGDGVEASCAGLLQFDAGLTALFDCSFRAAFRTSMEIVGSEATLQVPNPFKPGATEQLLLTRDGASRAIDVRGEAAYQGELEDMARQILDGTPPGLPLAESRAVVRVMVALHRSMRERRPVDVAESAA